MLRLVVKKTEIIECQNSMVKEIHKSLKNENDYILGFPSGNMECALRFNEELWFTSFEIGEDKNSPRFWNSLGLSEDLNESKSNNIVVEINIPTNGINRRVSGFFAINDQENKVYLLHRGRVGGGRKGIGKSSLVNWLATPLTQVDYEGKTEEALLIGCISDKKFSKNLLKFVSSIKQFKEFATSDEATDASFLSIEELEKIVCSESEKNPQKTTIKTTAFIRSSYISELAKKKAAGICQLCLYTAPFMNKYGQPYLETHHIEWLSRGGEDSPSNTVALCPNCHRKMHVLDSEKDKQQLKSRI